LQRLSSPISSVYNNLGNLQDVNNDNKIQFAREWLDAPLDIISIEYDTYANLLENQYSTERQLIEVREKDRASLSWHLTGREKRNIQGSIQHPDNLKALNQFTGLANNK
jgi:hypothetical protein